MNTADIETFKEYIEDLDDCDLREFEEVIIIEKLRRKNDF